jgi:hypothetical protein
MGIKIYFDILYSNFYLSKHERASLKLKSRSKNRDLNE